MSDKMFVTKSSLPEFDEYTKEISSIWESHWLTNMGEKHNLLQQQLTEFLGVKHLDLLVNGHMALEMSLQALNLQGKVFWDPRF